MFKKVKKEVLVADKNKVPVEDKNYELENKNVANITKLSEEVLLNIFKYCVNVEDVKDRNRASIGQVCKYFSKVIKHPSLYLDLIIINERNVDGYEKIIQKYYPSIRKIKIEDKNYPCAALDLLEYLKILHSLRYLKIKCTWLGSCGIKQINTALTKCTLLRTFKLLREGKHAEEKDVLELFGLVSKLQLDEFTYDEPYPIKWDVDAFLNKNMYNLTSLKVSATPERTEKTSNTLFVEKSLKLETLGYCELLKKLRLNYMKHVKPLCVRPLFSLQNLTYISIKYSEVNVDALSKFFLRPCCIKLKTVKLEGTDEASCTPILYSIVKYSHNLEKLMLKHNVRETYRTIPLDLLHNLLNTCKKLEWVKLGVIDSVEMYELDNTFEISNYPSLKLFCVTVLRPQQERDSLANMRNHFFEPRDITFYLADSHQRLSKKLKNFQVESIGDYKYYVKIICTVN